MPCDWTNHALNFTDFKELTSTLVGMYAGSDDSDVDVYIIGSGMKHDVIPHSVHTLLRRVGSIGRTFRIFENLGCEKRLNEAITYDVIVVLRCTKDYYKTKKA